MLQAALNTFLYFPERELSRWPSDLGLAAREVSIDTDDGERLHGWFVASERHRRGHVLFCHGNGGNIGDRLYQASLLATVGFDILLFDYRGYGRSSGRPSEEGTYRDARAAREVLLRQEQVTDSRVIYLGESLGGAVALALALDAPALGLVLQSTFSSVRDMAREHYRLPGFLVPDAYPNRARVKKLRSPLLILHGERDEIVPARHGRALFDAAPEPKSLRLFPGLGHNDLVERAGDDWAAAIASWRDGLQA